MISVDSGHKILANQHFCTYWYVGPTYCLDLELEFRIFLKFESDYSRFWNKRSPLNKRSPWKIWQKE